MQTKKGVTVDELRQALYFDEVGDLRWRGTGNSRRHARLAGTRAFNCQGNRGYLVGGFKGKLFQAHHVIFALHHGRWPKTLDHIDGDKKNNNPNNLREVSQKENTKNSSIRVDNKSGCTGVKKDTRTGSWLARITVDGKRIHLGSFKDFDLAVKARKAAEKRYRFHQHHGKLKISG